MCSTLWPPLCIYCGSRVTFVSGVAVLHSILEAPFFSVFGFDSVSEVHYPNSPELCLFAQEKSIATEFVCSSSVYSYRTFQNHAKHLNLFSVMWALRNAMAIFFFSNPIYSVWWRAVPHWHGITFCHYSKYRKSRPWVLFYSRMWFLLVLEQKFARMSQHLIMMTHTGDDTQPVWGRSGIIILLPVAHSGGVIVLLLKLLTSWVRSGILIFPPRDRDLRGGWMLWAEHLEEAVWNPWKAGLVENGWCAQLCTKNRDFRGKHANTVQQLNFIIREKTYTGFVTCATVVPMCKVKFTNRLLHVCH